jgi:hypothetical protein
MLTHWRVRADLAFEVPVAAIDDIPLIRKRFAVRSRTPAVFGAPGQRRCGSLEQGCSAGSVHHAAFKRHGDAAAGNLVRVSAFSMRRGEELNILRPVATPARVEYAMRSRACS